MVFQGCLCSISLATILALLLAKTILDDLGSTNYSYDEFYASLHQIAPSIIPIPPSLGPTKSILFIINWLSSDSILQSVIHLGSCRLLLC